MSEQISKQIADFPSHDTVIDPHSSTIIVPGWIPTEEFFKMQYDFVRKMSEDRLQHATELAGEDNALAMSYRMASSDMDFAAEIVRKLALAVGIDVLKTKKY